MTDKYLWVYKKVHSVRIVYVESLKSVINHLMVMALHVNQTSSQVKFIV